MPKLSVVLATLNRLLLLRVCLDSIGPACGDLEHEVIVVDGGSTDGTLEYLRALPIVLLEQGQALGAVAAFNAGFALADGEYVANLNDDCAVLGQTLRLACDYLDAHVDVGQVAIPYGLPGVTPTTQSVWLGRKRHQRLYANFGVTRRWLGNQVGWWGNYLNHYGGDCELSANIWMAGCRVAVLPGGHIEHYEANDATRRPNDRGGSAAFYAKWRQLNLKRLPA